MVNGSLAQDLTPVAQAASPAEGPTDRNLLERFVRCQDQAAFEALVRRHGAMVLGVCRRVLDHSQDAEDAFQATFLVLVRKARSVGRPELLGNWLYGVAYRTSRKARAQATRRSRLEKRAAPTAVAELPAEDLAWKELRTVLDEELQRLPYKYRAPLVLCYLEGLTNEEAARKLGWPVGSMSYRLARGRDLLRARLRKRDQSLPAGMVVALLARHAGPGAVPPGLTDAAVRAATGAVSPRVGALADQTARALTAARRRALLRVLLGALLALLLTTGAWAYAAWTGRPASGQLSDPGKAVPPTSEAGPGQAGQPTAAGGSCH